jgi:cold shock CspA family protein
LCILWDPGRLPGIPARQSSDITGLTAKKAGEAEINLTRVNRGRIKKMKNKGRISVYHANRGFGFIHETSNGKLLTYFFHISSVISGDPRGGLPVQFTPISNSKGLTAVDIEIGGAV